MVPTMLLTQLEWGRGIWRAMIKLSSTQEQDSSELGGRLDQENCVVEARLSYTVRFHLKEKNLL